MKNSAAAKLRRLLSDDKLIVMPCCFDPLSAKLIEQEGFTVTFMSGFSVAAARLGVPDVGLISYSEILDQGRNICDAVSIPVIGDADTGYGNALNIRRTVQGFSKAGFSAVMIEDQVAPKRCGHTNGKSVVSREDAYKRIKAAVDTRTDSGDDILILARTDARHVHGLNEAIDRALRFHEIGADILFVEAPTNEVEMRQICKELPGPKMINLLEGGQTPILSPSTLEEMGFKLAAYPTNLLAASMQAMVKSLCALKNKEEIDTEHLMPFNELKSRIGFDEYFDLEKKYAFPNEN